MFLVGDWMKDRDEPKRPENMSRDERVREVAKILAKGFHRMQSTDGSFKKRARKQRSEP